MSNKFLAIDIKHDLLTAIVFTVDAKVMHIIDQTMVTVAARPLEEALMELSQKIDCQEAFCHIALEAESFFYRNLLLPFTDTKTINKILPFELEENTPVKIDRLLIDAMIAREGKQKSQIIAAMIDRDLLATRLATLQALGIDPEAVTISGIPTALRLTHTPDLPADFLLLTLDLQRATCILVRSGHISLIRPLVFDPGLQAGFHVDLDSKSIMVFRPENIENTFQVLCIAIQQTLQSVFHARELAVYLSGPVGALPGIVDRIQTGLGGICQSCTLVSAVPSVMDSLVLPFMPTQDEKWLSGIMEDSVNLGWQITKNWKGFNFRKEAFATRKSFTDSRTLAFAIVLPLISVVLLSILYLWVDYTKLLKKQSELNAQIHAVFTETLPEITRIVDPLQQLQVKIRETRQTTMNKDGTLPAMTILDILAEISANIPETLDVRLARFVVDDTGLRLKGTTDTFNTVDAIKKGLEQSPAFGNVEISAANLDAKSSKIRFELKLTMKGV
ncbi:MAG: PilN domain-containing protein [Deltaproteobacteria bacterium]|nr:PilN domain-containing protein [Deltaproteobacteria bacterium]